MSEPHRRQIQRAYPQTITLANQAAVTVRLMTATDADRLLRFARTLPEEDLLFLPADITDPEVVAQWVADIVARRSVTVLAEAAEEVVGYASLHRSRTTWQRHVGELRVQVGPRYRGQGLGRALAGEMFAVARALGLRKILAQMTPDQKAAVATFEHLGFQREARLHELILDRRGRTRDLLIMTYDAVAPAPPHDWTARLRRAGVPWRSAPDR